MHHILPPPKRKLSVTSIIFVSVLLLSPTSTALAFAGGAGTLGDPYLISTCLQLQDVKDHLSSSFKLTTDIDCSATASWNSGAGFEPIGIAEPFTGRFDGQGNSINQITLANAGVAYSGIFSRLSGAQIYALEINDVQIVSVAPQTIGALAGLANNNTVIRGVNLIGSSVSIAGGTFGGIVGETDDVTFSEIEVRANISGSSPTQHIGGIVGSATDTTITDFMVIGEVTNDTGNVGGVFGLVNGTSSITEGYVQGDVYNQTSGNSGGLVGSVGTSNLEIAKTIVNSLGGSSPDAVLVGNEGSLVPSFDNNWYYNLFVPCAGSGGVGCESINNITDYYGFEAMMNQPTMFWDLGGSWSFFDNDSLPTLSGNYTAPAITTPNLLIPTFVSGTVVRFVASVSNNPDANSFTHIGTQYSTTNDFATSSTVSTATSSLGVTHSMLATGLSCGTLYYYRPYITLTDSSNSYGTSGSFTTTTCSPNTTGNLIINGGAETGNLNGWVVTASGGNGWGIAGWGNSGSSSFATSFGFDTRYQTVDLHELGFTTGQLSNASTTITFSEWISTRNDQGGRYYLKVLLLGEDADPSNPLATYTVGSLGSPITLSAGVSWFERTNTFSSLPAGVRYVYVEDGGRDVSNWAGHYGTHFDDASVTIEIGDEETPSEVVVPQTTASRTSAGSIMPGYFFGLTNVPAISVNGVALNSSSSSGIMSTSSVAFTRNLNSGLIGPDVKLLQQTLNRLGFVVSTKGPGSIGNETTVFGRGTRSALINMQKQYKISPAIGYFGPITRGVLSGLK